MRVRLTLRHRYRPESNVNSLGKRQCLLIFFFCRPCFFQCVKKFVGVVWTFPVDLGSAVLKPYDVAFPDESDLYHVM